MTHLIHFHDMEKSGQGILQKLTFVFYKEQNGFGMTLEQVNEDRIISHLNVYKLDTE